MSTDHSVSSGCDLQIMLRIRDGDTVAFTVLVERWQPRLARFLGHLGAASHDIDDLLQETFLRVFSYRGRFEARHERAVGALLLLIARRVHVDLTRRRRPSRVSGRGGGPALRLGEADEPPCPRASRTDLRDDLIDLEGAISRLSPKLRSVIVLVSEHGLSYPEVSRVLGVPPGTVKSRMHYAVRRLSEILDVEATV